MLPLELLLAANPAPPINFSTKPSRIDGLLTLTLQIRVLFRDSILVPNLKKKKKDYCYLYSISNCSLNTNNHNSNVFIPENLV